ncbi:MAG TPA: hypothetical protein VKS60_16485, partial [Stellaceae bacterium]|nr:hypothetical protein [Stellaceae bacterium]
MARTNALSPEALAALGAAKLARIILDEVETNAAFRRRVVAATASGQGAEAVAKLLDRRLAGLERARGRVDWEKERDFAADLSATVGTILKELAPLSPDRAVHTLLRFIDTHGAVLERIDDSSGRIQAVYWGASEAMPDLVERLSPGEQTVIPDRLMKSLAKDTHGLAAGIAVAVVPKLPEPVLARWDEDLRQRSGDVRLVEIRQAIADMRGDLDLYLALELERPDWRQNPLRAAERLLAAGRLDEALSWVRRPRKGGVAYATEADIADGRIRRPATLERVRLEARILEAMKDRPAAQALRWDTFENTLDAEILREYLRKLDDFREFEELERAFAVAAAGPLPYTGLAFFIAWPRLDRAA